MNCLCLSSLLCPVYEIRIHITSTDERILFSWTTNYCLDWGNASKIIEKNIQKKKLVSTHIFSYALVLMRCSLDFSLRTTLPLHPSHTVHSTQHTLHSKWVHYWNLKFEFNENLLYFVFSCYSFVLCTQEVIREALIRKISKTTV